MIRAAITFFIFGLLFYFLGAYRVAGLSVEIGKILLFVFLALAAFSLIGSLFSRGRA